MQDRPGSASGPTGVPWDDGEITFRLRGPGREPGRIIRVRRPFALVGRHPRADVRFDDRAVAARHALLVLDGRGLLCVDLMTRSGTRCAGLAVASTWLGTGDAIEIAGRRLEVLRFRASGVTIDPTPGDDDPFAPTGPDLPRVSLAPPDPNHPPWVIATRLAFLGRSAACGLRLRGSALAPIHCAIWQEPGATRVIDLMGRTTEVDGRPVVGSASLASGGHLRVGRAEFTVAIETLTPQGFPIALARETSPALTLAMGDGPDLAELLEFLRQFQGDAATLIEGQFAQIDALRRDLAALRDQVEGRKSPPGAVYLPFRMEVPSPAAPGRVGTNAAWLLARIHELEPETRTHWRDWLARIVRR